MTYVSFKLLLTLAIESYNTFDAMLPILITLLLFLPHGNLSQRIEEKTDQIAEQPENWILCLQRGELRFQLDQAGSAIIDYTIALNNGLDTTLIC